MRNGSVVVAGLMLLPGVAAADSVMFYGGDWNHRGVLADSTDSMGITERWVFDDFQWNGGTVTKLFANYLSNSATIEGMEFQIRAGMGGSDGGTLVARGGGTSTWQQTGTLGAGLGWYLGTLDIADMSLPAGTYFLGIHPIMPMVSGFARIATTNGLHGVGSPLGNDNSFLWSRDFGYQRAAPSVSPPSATADFSQGVYGPSLVPLPPAALAGGAVLAGLAGFRVIRRRANRA